MKSILRKFFIGLLIILMISFPIRAAQAGDLFDPFTVVTTLFDAATALTVSIIAPLALVTILPLIPMDFITGNWVLCQVMGIDGPIFQNCGGGGNPIIMTTQNLGECAFSYQPTFYIPQFSSGETNNQVALYRFSIPASSDQTTLNNWYFYTIKDNVGNGFTILGGDKVTPSSDACSMDSQYHVAAGNVTPLGVFPYTDECVGNVCNKVTDGSVPPNSYVVYVAKMLGNYIGWKTYPSYSEAPSDCFQNVNNPNKFLNKNNQNVATFPDPNIGLGNAIIGPFLTGSCPISPPTASISADSTSISYNSATTIRWSSTDATSCTVSPPGWTGTSGAQSTGNLTSSQTYTVSCTGPGGSVSASVTVSVGGAPAPTASISADSTSITYNTATTIRWSSTNATSCAVSPTGWTGISGAQGTGNLTSSQTYTVSCTGPGGSVSASVTVSVGGAPTMTFSVDSTSVIYNTGTTLRWSSSNTTYCTASGDWGGGKSLSGAEDTGNITSSKTYTLTCGSPGASVSNSVSVSIQPPGNFNLSTGGSVACNSVPLNWTAASGAQAYRILRGSPRVDISPYQPYTAQNFSDTSVSQNTSYPYQIEAYNSGGTNRSNTININTPYCPPTLNFSTNSSSIYQGQSTTLSWATSYTTSCTASGGWSGSKPLNGSQVVVPLPPPSVTYNLNCSGPGGSVSGSTTINITPLLLPDWHEIIPR